MFKRYKEYRIEYYKYWGVDGDMLELIDSARHYGERMEKIVAELPDMFEDNVFIIHVKVIDLKTYDVILARDY